MRLAYLLNSYPMTSTTFIRREIAAVEEAGQPVTRFAVRTWTGGPLVDREDVAETARTEYLLQGRQVRLMADLVAALVRSPVRLLAVLPLWWRLWRARGGLVPHVAYLAQAVRLRRRCADLGIDRLHTHFSTNATTVALLCRGLGGPAYSFTVHGPDELDELDANGIVAKVRAAAAVVAITEFCAQRLRTHLPEDLWDRITVVPCGLDLRQFPFADAPPSGERFVTVGRLTPQKAQDELPAAVAALRDDHGSIRLELVGDGPLRGAVETAVHDHGVQRQVHLAGWRDSAEVRSLIRDARALLLPSHHEGLPIVIMEALALGRPVIATRIAGIPELIDDTCGWLYDAGDADGLLRALRDCLDADPETLAELAREGRRRVETRHDLRRIAPQLLAVFAR